MKLSNRTPLFTVSFLSLTLSFICADGSSDHASCTHGKLFVADAGSGSMIHVIDLNVGSNLTKEGTVEVNGGPAANELYVSHNQQVIAVMYYGSEVTNYTDGVVNWIHTGAELKDDGTVAFTFPIVLPNAAFDCVLPLHFTTNGDLIAIFCDGNYDIQSNSTVWAIDESKLNAASINENAIMYNTTILSSHHGNAVPIENDHLLYSLATPDRIRRNVNGTDDELGSTFAIMDLQGNVVYNVNDTNHKNTSCTGHHGIANTYHTAILACDEIHGGVLMVSYDEDSQTYQSRALAYPITGYRSFHFEQHHSSRIAESSIVVGDLLLYNVTTDELSSFHLFAFSIDDVSLTEQNVVQLPTEQYPCGFSYEKSQGKIILAFLAEGLLVAYEFQSNDWTELARLQVIPNMTECSQAVFAAGYTQAFVLTTVEDNTTIHAIDLSKVHTEGIMTTYATSMIDFVPYFAVVAGVPPSTGCNSTSTSNIEQDTEGDRDDGVTTGTSTAAAVSFSQIIQVMGIIMAGGVIVIMTL